MKRMSNVWFTSDPHFSHKNIILYADRPFLSVEEMDELLIENYNSLIKKDDTVFCLGDFAMGNKNHVKDLLKKLNGRWNLILGNHDRLRPEQYMELGFHWASRFPIIFNEFFILSHAPLFLIKHPYINIHGHLHQMDYPSKTNDYFNCCLEKTNYLPVDLKTIQKYVKKSTYDFRNNV